MTQTVTKAVIPIGGIGSRFLPATKIVGKELFPLVDRPILLELLNECVESGITDVFIVLSPNKMNVKDFFKYDKKLEARLAKDGKSKYLEEYHNIISKLNISFGVQKVARGSGDALFPAEKWTKGEPFAVLFGDDLNYTPQGMRPAIGQCIDAYELTHKLVIGCKPVSMEQIPAYSSCIIGKKVAEGIYETSGIIEKPAKEDAPSNLSGLAHYVLTPNIFDVLRRTPIDKRGELGLTDAMDIIAKEHGATICSFKSIRYDTGNKFGYMQAQIEYMLRNKDLSEELKTYLKSLVSSNFLLASDLEASEEPIIVQKQ